MSNEAFRQWTQGDWYEEDRGERIVVLAPGYDREILSVDVPEGEPEEETQRANAAIARAALAKADGK